MTRTSTYVALALGVLGLLCLPSTASALLELDMGFEPAEVCPGENVQFFFMLENVGGDDEMVEFAVTLTFHEFTIGPIMGQFRLAAGEQVSHEFDFMVPPPTPPGLLTITATATDSGGTVEATAELEILECERAGRGLNGQQLLQTLKRELRGIGLR